MINFYISEWLKTKRIIKSNADMDTVQIECLHITFQFIKLYNKFRELCGML